MTKTAWFDAVRRGDVNAVGRILERKPALVNARDRSDRNALHIACSACSSVGRDPRRLVDLLVDHGAEIESTSGKDRCTPLFFAVARARDPRLVRHLLGRGARPAHAPGGALFAAGWFNDAATLALLIRAGAEVDVVVGVTPFLASWCWRKFKAARYLVRCGADPNFRDPKSGRTALHYGVEREYDPAELRWLVAHEASPDIEDRRAVTARALASKKRNRKWLSAIAGSR